MRQVDLAIPPVGLARQRMDESDLVLDPEQGPFAPIVTGRDLAEILRAADLQDRLAGNAVALEKAASDACQIPGDGAAADKQGAELGKHQTWSQHSHGAPEVLRLEPRLPAMAPMYSADAVGAVANATCDDGKAWRRPLSVSTTAARLALHAWRARRKFVRSRACRVAARSGSSVLRCRAIPQRARASRERCAPRRPSTRFPSRTPLTYPTPR